MSNKYEKEKWYGDQLIDEMVGKTFSSVIQLGEDQIVFVAEDNTKYLFEHHQDCCESVFIESVVGDLNDLIGTPLLKAEISFSDENPPDAKPETIEYQESFTWTFYKFATIKGYVDIRWYGGSNGWYSERVTITKATVN